MSWAITCQTSSLVRTVGKRLGLLAHTNSRGRSRSLRSTSRYRRSNALGTLILCRSRHVFLYGQVGEKTTDFLLTHFQRMAFVLIEDKVLGPVYQGFLGAAGRVLEPNCIGHLVE